MAKYVKTKTTKANVKNPKKARTSTKTVFRQPDTRKYAGSAGKRQFQIDRINALKASKTAQIGKTVTDVTGQVTGIAVADKAATTATGSWNSLINGLPEAAEGTGDGRKNPEDITINPLP